MPISFLIGKSEAMVAFCLHFLRWYFLEAPVRMTKTYGAYVRALGEIFSFLFLVKTLLSPWKSIRDEYPHKGFNIGVIAQAFTLNMTSRAIGLVFRLTALVVGLTMEVLCLATFLATITVWLIFPVLLLLDLLFFLRLIFV
jgi:hypothetical protein